MKELTLREIQNGEAEVLREVVRICDECGLRYYLFYGTLIGAIRHEGFIPWDDDVDIVMPRPDYEKFIEYVITHAAEGDRFVLKNYRTDKNYVYPISRYCDTRYYVDYANTEDYGLGLFVDIYPFDGAGDTVEEVAATQKKRNRLRVLITTAGKKRFIKSRNGVIRTVGKFLAFIYAKAVGVNSLLRRMDKAAKKIPYESSKYVSCTMWEVDYYEREWLEPCVLLKFEGEVYRAPGRYDIVLKQCYSDYMEFPPEEERRPHHDYRAYLKDKENE
ncbi:MAG: LicD family protein [Lachnospiraceae bacterium]|jgi:lipopolysaccharide cholinephosphotransferase